MQYCFSYKTAQQEKLKFILKIGSFKYLISHFLPKLQQQHFKTAILLSKYQVGFKELCEDKPNKHFLRDNFGKTAILHKLDPVAWWEKLNRNILGGKALHQIFGSSWVCNLQKYAVRCLNIQSNFQKWRRQPAEILNNGPCVYEWQNCWNRRGYSHILCRVHSADKHFFEIGKD